MLLCWAEWVTLSCYGNVWVFTWLKACLHLIRTYRFRVSKYWLTSYHGTDSLLGLEYFTLI